LQDCHINVPAKSATTLRSLMRFPKHKSAGVLRHLFIGSPGMVSLLLKISNAADSRFVA
jgi:hypothetical protein